MATNKELEKVPQSPEVNEENVPVQEEMSQRDRYRSRIKEANPELDMDDEDAYYKAANERLDDYESLNTGINNLRNAMDNNSYFAQMIAEASKQKNFNPVAYLIENGMLDLDAASTDEEYAKTIAEAQSKWLDKNTKAKELEDKIAANLPGSIEACKAKGQELGLSEEQCDEVLNKYFSLLDEIEQGNLSPDIFELLAKGTTHDADVAEAEKQGAAQGRATKVKETLQSMPKQSARSGGSQPSGAEPRPVKGQNNMFGF